VTTPNDVALTYNSYVTQICTLAVYQYSTIAGIVVPTESTPFLVPIIPQMINYAELRLQRDLDFLQSLLVNTSYNLTNGNNVLTLSVDNFITLQTIQYTSGTAIIPILATSKEYIQNVYNDSSFSGPPAYFAPYGGDASTTGATSQLWLFGPYPDQNYPLTIMGTARMISLNSYGSSGGTAGTNTTFISAYLPDLMLAASMIYLSGAQRNFGAQASDPQMAMSWENQYQTLLKGATVEEARRKFQAGGWSSMSVPTVATNTR
jgi:hypothetical protein